jgi:hypothetical protein
MFLPPLAPELEDESAPFIYHPFLKMYFYMCFNKNIFTYRTFNKIIIYIHKLLNIYIFLLSYKHINLFLS